MNKDLFIETLSKIEEQLKLDNKCHEAFSIILPNDYVSGYDYNLVLNQLLKLLKIDLDDKSNWIDYFIWDLDFGRNFKMGMVSDENNNNIDLSNSEKLFEFLIKYQ